jgi:hypothetical protein
MISIGNLKTESVKERQLEGRRLQIMQRRGEHQSHCIETYRDIETNVAGYEGRDIFEENHRMQ